MQDEELYEQENRRTSLTFDDVLRISLSRRRLLQGSVGVAVSSILAGCGSGSDSADLFEDGVPGSSVGIRNDDRPLNFASIPTSDGDFVSIPEGHSAQVLYACGDPIVSELDAYSNAGLEGGEEFDLRSGDHHDGMYFFRPERCEPD